MDYRKEAMNSHDRIQNEYYTILVLVESLDPLSGAVFADNRLNSVTRGISWLLLATNSRRETLFSSLCGVHCVGEPRRGLNTGFLWDSTVLLQSRVHSHILVPPYLEVT